MKKDIVTLVATPCDYGPCMESEGSCDCGDSYHIEVNGSMGYGSGGWVLNTKTNKEGIQVTGIVNCFYPTLDQVIAHLKMYFQPFKNVEVEYDYRA